MKIMQNRMTKKVGLVLISSSLILNGCSHHVPEQDPAQEGQPPVVVTQPGGSGVHSWWYFHSGGYSGGGYSGGFTPGVTGGSTHGGGVVVSGGSGSRGGFSASPSVSARGGFGAAGHAFGGSGA